jgi:hypothetical protein
VHDNTGEYTQSNGSFKKLTTAVFIKAIKRYLEQCDTALEKIAPNSAPSLYKIYVKNSPRQMNTAHRRDIAWPCKRDCQHSKTRKWAAAKDSRPAPIFTRGSSKPGAAVSGAPPLL